MRDNTVTHWTNIMEYIMRQIRSGGVGGAVYEICLYSGSGRCRL